MTVLWPKLFLTFFFLSFYIIIKIILDFELECSMQVSAPSLALDMQYADFRIKLQDGYVGFSPEPYSFLLSFWCTYGILFSETALADACAIFVERGFVVFMPRSIHDPETVAFLIWFFGCRILAPSYYFWEADFWLGRLVAAAVIWVE
jgi:hypothetical protein